MMADQNYLSIYAKSFNWAGFFLPKKTYLKCSVLYDFCRVADNIADSNETIELKKIKFLDFQKNFNNKNWLLFYLNWEINLINNLGFGFSIDSKKFSDMKGSKTISIKLDNIDYKIPSFLIFKDFKNLDSKDLHNALNFSRSDFFE